MSRLFLDQLEHRVLFSTTVTVDDDGVQNPSADFNNISDAVAAASPGDTIKVSAGTYTEKVTIDKTLTLLGARSGKDGRNRNGLNVNESVVNGADGSFDVHADGVKIDGFTVRDAVGDNTGI